MQQAGLAQLLEEVADIDGDDVVAVGLALPDSVDQLLARQDLARMAQEMGQEVELRGGQDDRAVASPRVPARGLEAQIAKPQMVCGRGTAKKRPNARQQLLVGERLDQVVVGSRIEATHALLGAAQRGEQKNRYWACRAQPLAHGDAVQARQ